MMLRTDSSVRVVWEPVGPVSSESDMGVRDDESRAFVGDQTRKIRQLENAYCLSSLQAEPCDPGQNAHAQDCAVLRCAAPPLMLTLSNETLNCIYT